jgi:TrmH family RNA methyltransferase
MNNISVVLVRPGISGNVGAVARAMANFGFSKLVIVDPKCSIDDEARNRAKHAQSVLKNSKIEHSLEKALSNFSIVVATTGILGSDFNILRSPLLVEDAAKKIMSVKGNEKIAVIFGPEDAGLSKEELELCDYTATIPASKSYPVMNLSHAVSVFLYELSKNENSQIIKKEFPLVDKREKEELEKVMISAIESVKYRTPFEKKTQLLVWKRILGKSMPTRREAFAMIGLLKKLSNKKDNKK